MSQQGDIDPRSQRFHQYDVLVIPMTDEQKPVLIKDLRFQGIMQIGDPIYVEAGKRMGSYYNSNEDGLPEFESRYFEALGKSAQNLIHLGKVTGIVESDEEASELEAMINTTGNGTSRVRFGTILTTISTIPPIVRRWRDVVKDSPLPIFYRKAAIKKGEAGFCEAGFYIQE